MKNLLSILLLPAFLIAFIATAQTPAAPVPADEEDQESPTAVDILTPVTAIYIDSTGKVGVKTKKPGAQLDVNGDLRANLYYGAEGSSPFFINSDESGPTPAFTITIGGNDGDNRTKFKFRGLLATDWWGFKLKKGDYKNFIIDHPTDPERWLVHATIEGPEAAVYYRGSAQLTNGRTVVALPAYFEALTREEGRTIQLSNIDGFDRLMVQTHDGKKISGGTFVVVSDDTSSSQQFDWEVKAVRRDGALLIAEPRRDEIEVDGIGPYRFYRVK